MTTLVRVRVTSKITLTQVFEVDGVPTDAAGAVTVTVDRLDGTNVNSGSATHGATGSYSYEIPASLELDTWTVDFSGVVAGATVVVRDVVEHVGGFLFPISRARKDLKLKESWTVDKLTEKRIEVEQECEAICRTAWVPRFTRVYVDGSGTDELIVPDLFLRRVRAVSIVGADGVAGTPYDAGQLGYLAATSSGVIVHRGGSPWPMGRENVLVEYEYGKDYPPAAITTAAISHLSERLTTDSGGIPARALSWTAQDGGVYRLTMPGAEAVGIPSIDSVYKRHGQPRVWIA